MRLLGCSICILATLMAAATVTAEDGKFESAGRALEEVFGNLDRSKISTGILYDRVVPFSHIADHDGGKTAGPVSLSEWRQMYHEMYRASLGKPSWPSLGVLWESRRRLAAYGAIPIAFMDFRYNRIRPEALREGSLVIRGGHVADGEGDPYVEAGVFAVTALKDYTHRGEEVTFALDPDWYVSNYRIPPREVQIDFGDGLGVRLLPLDGQYPVTYTCPGRKTIRVSIPQGDGVILEGSFHFHVRALQTPTPHDTLAVVASIPYDGDFGSGEAYVYLSDLHTSLTDPVIVIEGFDIDNSMGWEDLYHLLNQEGLVETLRADGYDAVVLNFAEATDYIQRNAFVAVELIQQINAAIGGQTDIAVVGASMGGLVGRYALAYMEASALDHNVRTFVSFDSPQTGANIPLGLQYWVKFFSDDSEDAAYMLERLDTPAARQMLAYHYTDPPGATGQSDLLRTALLADLASLGDYPANLRKVAIANGSGFGSNQGFAPGDQVILYEYSSFLVDIIGNVWAVPDSASHIIFDGLMDLIWPLPDRAMTVHVDGTEPYDNAPGGFRGSMAQMDSTEAPYGDIIALHDNHCFIPTTSALAIETEDLFYDVAGDPDLMAHTPFDTLYYPAGNEEHMTITPQSAAWFLSEVGREEAALSWDPVHLPDEALLCENSPNPFSLATLIRYSVPRSERVRLDVFDIAGRRVVTLADGWVGAGWRQVVWDGLDRDGRKAASGVYFCRLTAGGERHVIRLVLLR